MIEIFNELFEPGKFKVRFKITWIYVCAGTLMLFLFFLLAAFIVKKGFFHHFLENTGMFLMFTSLLVAYSGVYHHISLNNNETTVKGLVKESFGKIHYVFGISFVTVLFLSLIVLFEFGFSYISMIPYAGPAIISIMTIPYLFINIVLFVLAVCVFFLFPPMIYNDLSLKDIAIDVRDLIRQKWLVIAVYSLVSILLLLVLIVAVLFVVKYTAGITKSLQWKIELTYPKMIQALTMKSYFTDLIKTIAPGSDSIAALKQYGTSIFRYIDMLRYVIGFSYLIAFTAIISFPLTVFFNFSSIVHKRITAK